MSRTIALGLALAAALLLAAGVVFVGLDDLAVSAPRSEPKGPGPDVLAEPHPVPSLSARFEEAKQEAAAEFAIDESRIREAAENGDPQAQFDLGAAYAVGFEWLPRDFVQAHRWFVRASENGHPVAPVHVGRMLKIGYGVARDPAEAVKWFRIAMERDNPTGAYELARLYETGQYQFPADPKKAMDLYRRAARDGSLSSAYRLGQFYYFGWPEVTKDYREAAKWFERSVETHHFPAYRYLATIYTEEKGSAYDPVEGLKWLIVDDATDLMPQYLKDRHEKLRAALSPAQIAEAERRAKVWLEEHSE